MEQLRGYWFNQINRAAQGARLFLQEQWDLI